MHADVVSRTGSADMVPELRDGYEVHRAALRFGLDVVTLARQVTMISGHASAESEQLAFVHGIPRTSTLSAVTYAQDKRMRRALLTHAGLPIPKGGSFSVGRGIEHAKRLIERIDYPVVVKPAEGDNMSETQAGLRNEQELLAAIEYLRTPVSTRPTYTRAAYALTMLSEPDESDGKLKVPSNYRFLVEKHVPGEYLRFLVVGDQVRSVVHCPGGSWARDTQRPRDVTGETHTSLLRMAEQVVRAVPGLAIGAVDIVAPDHHRDVTEQDVRIVEVSERPWLAAQFEVSAELSHQLGETILSEHARDVSVALSEPQEDIAVELHMDGITEPEPAIAAFVDAGHQLGVRGHVRVSDPVEGSAEGVVQGSPGSVAWLAEMFINGKLYGHRAMLIEERHRAVEQREPLTVHR